MLPWNAPLSCGVRPPPSGPRRRPSRARRGGRAAICGRERRAPTSSPRCRSRRRRAARLSPPSTAPHSHCPLGPSLLRRPRAPRSARHRRAARGEWSTDHALVGLGERACLVRAAAPRFETSSSPISSAARPARRGQHPFFRRLRARCDVCPPARGSVGRCQGGPRAWGAARVCWGRSAPRAPAGSILAAPRRRSSNFPGLIRLRICEGRREGGARPPTKFDN